MFLKKLQNDGQKEEGGQYMITIIVSIYNAEEYLTKCLNDLRYQTYHKLEIILVNNGSIDSSGEICERFSKADTRFKVIHKKNDGLSAAFNAGLLIAKGKYVSFVNAFDRVESIMFEHLLSLIIKTNGDMVVCDYIEEDSTISSEQAKTYNMKEWSKTKAIQKEINRETEQGFMHNKLFKMDLFKRPEALRFNPNIFIYEDLLLYIECVLKSEKIFYTPAPYYHTFKSRYPIRVELSRLEQETGLRTLLFIIDLCISFKELDIAKLKGRYATLNIELLMRAYDQSLKEKREVEKFKKNLYRFKLTELENMKLRIRCLVARRNSKLSYFIWKLQNKEKYSLVGI